MMWCRAIGLACAALLLSKAAIAATPGPSHACEERYRAAQASAPRAIAPAVAASVRIVADRGGFSSVFASGHHGSGVLVTDDGLIATSAHLVSGATRFTATVADGAPVPARLVLTAPRLDLALIAIEGAGLCALSIPPPGAAKIGQGVFVLGYPFGSGLRIRPGVVTAAPTPSRAIADVLHYVETDAAMQPGDSGGAVVDAAGNLLAINTGVYRSVGAKPSRAFAVPADFIAPLVARARANRPGGAAWLGLEIAPPSDPRGHESVIVGVYPGSPAANAGLEPGDLIADVDGDPLTDQAGIDAVIASHRIADRISLKIDDARAVREMSIVLAAAPSGPAPQVMTLVGDQPLGGATVGASSPALAQRYGASPFADGVLILDAGHAAADQSGFMAGDVVMAVNGHRVGDPARLSQSLDASKTWRVEIIRGYAQLSQTFRKAD
jgi:S1-C subfamily serine protease